MRQFSAQYLADTRAGMWEHRDALADLELASRDRILEVGCGSGEFTRVLSEDSDGTVVGVDVDRRLLSEIDADGRILGDATALPVRDDAVDLGVCQALLINLPAPIEAVRELARVSSALVAAVEPDNSAVGVDSTVGVEGDLARRARTAYIDGLDTDVTLGPDVAELFEHAGLRDVRTRTYYHTRTIEPPYDEVAVESAARKVRADRLDAGRETMLAGDLTEQTFEALRSDWQAMGRVVVDQMENERYRRTEVVPFYVTVGRVVPES